MNCRFVSALSCRSAWCEGSDHWVVCDPVQTWKETLKKPMINKRKWKTNLLGRYRSSRLSLGSTIQATAPAGSPEPLTPSGAENFAACRQFWRNSSLPSLPLLKRERWLWTGYHDGSDSPYRNRLQSRFGGRWPSITQKVACQSIQIAIRLWSVASFSADCKSLPSTISRFNQYRLEEHE